MATCPECGSEVADQDLFCPFCGISLGPVAGAGNSDIDEFASTVIIDKPQARQGVENPEQTVAVDKDAGGNDRSAEIPLADMDAVPTPTILSEFERDSLSTGSGPRNDAGGVPVANPGPQTSADATSP